VKVNGRALDAPSSDRRSGPVLARLRAALPGMTKREAVVAGMILESPGAYAGSPLTQVAAHAGVSTATVVRTCRAAGFGGYRDFQLALVGDVGRGPALVAGDIADDDTPMDMVRKVFAADLGAITATLALLEEATVLRAVQLLVGAERIEVYGIGSSAPVAVDAYYRFLRIGVRVGVVTDAHMQGVSASCLTPRDVAVVISHTGRTRETVETARLAVAAGARLIVVTSFLDTPVAEFADVVLVAAAAETEYRVEAMASRIAHLSLIDALYVLLAHARGDGARSALQRTNRIIEHKRIPRRNRGE
jgi:RpiR family transcriptional regulator, carbohydrate utilization regulator